VRHQGPDERVDRMAEIFHPKKITYISMAFHDIDAGETDPLSPQALTELRSIEVLALVVRPSPTTTTRRLRRPGPGGGIRELSSAIVLSDYLVAQKRIERMTKEAKRDAEWTTLHKAIAAFERDIPLRSVDLSIEEERVLSGFRFVSRLPTLLVLNVGEGEATAETYPEVTKEAEKAKVPLVRLCAKVEEEIAQLSPTEQADFLKEMGIARSAGTSSFAGPSRRRGTSLSLRWGGRGPRLERAGGGHRPDGGGEDPLRPGKRVHPCRGHLLRRFPPVRVDGEGQDGRKTAARGKGVRRQGRGYRSRPVQRVNPPVKT